MFSKNNKKGFQLSLNMIIIAVIAVVFLGVAIALITSWGSMLEDEIPKIFPPNEAFWTPTTDNPVMFSTSEITLKKGDDKTIELQVYNYAVSNVTCNIVFNSQNDELTFLYSSANRAIPVDMIGEWSINIDVPKTATQNAYLYTANIDCGAFTKQTDVIVTIE